MLLSKALENFWKKKEKMPNYYLVSGRKRALRNGNSQFSGKELVTPFSVLTFSKWPPSRRSKAWIHPSQNVEIGKVIKKNIPRHTLWVIPIF